MTSTRSPSPDRWELGDAIVAALHLVGVTEKRVSDWLGKPCHCRRRAVKLNQLDRWARRVLSGKERRPLGWIQRMMGSRSYD